MANLQAELNQFFGIGTKTLRMWLGVVKPCNKKNAAKIMVPQFDFDTWLNAYFRDSHIYFAYDPEKKCKTGDTVLIKELPEKKTTLITHEVIRVIYPLGDVTDPISGRKCTKIRDNVPKFRDDLEKLAKLYGERPNRFKYEDAPPRGWLEGKRDFSDKEVTIQYHDDGTRSNYEENFGKNFSRPEYEWPLNN